MAFVVGTMTAGQWDQTRALRIETKSPPATTQMELLLPDCLPGYVTPDKLLTFSVPLFLHL